MTFTFSTSPQDDDELTLVVIRQRIGDTIQGDGPRPNSLNYEDEEIQIALAAEGNHPERAAARLLETLQAEWSKRTGSETLAAIQEASQQAYAFGQAAKAIRAKWGFGTHATLTVGGAETSRLKMSKARNV